MWISVLPVVDLAGERSYAVELHGTIANRSAPRPSSEDEIRSLLTEWIEVSKP